MSSSSAADRRDCQRPAGLQSSASGMSRCWNAKPKPAAFRAIAATSASAGRAIAASGAARISRPPCAAASKASTSAPAPPCCRSASDGVLRIRDRSGLGEIAARRILIATGTRETPRAPRFAGGSRPQGVMTTGALQQHVYLQGFRPFKAPVIVGTEWVSFSAILTCRHLGIRPVAMIEAQARTSAPWPGGPIARLVYGVPVLLNSRIRRDQGQAAGRGRRDRDARTAPRPGLRRRDLHRRIRARARGLCRRTDNLHRRQCQCAAQDVRAVLARRPRYGRAHRQEFSHESHCRRPGHDRHQVLRAGRRRQLPRRRQLRAPADLPAARLGGARRRGIAEPRLRCHFCRRRRRLHRDRQPGRDGGGLGCRERQARLQRHRLAGRPHQGHDGAAEGRGP